MQRSEIIQTEVDRVAEAIVVHQQIRQPNVEDTLKIVAMQLRRDALLVERDLALRR